MSGFFGGGSGGGGLVTPVSVPNGGTGVATLLDHGLIVGSGIADVTVLAVGLTAQVLKGNTGADPSWGAVDLTTDVTGLLPVGSGGTGVGTLLIHGVLIGNTTGAVNVTAVGATGEVLKGVTGADPVFGAVDLTTDVTGILPVPNGGTGLATITDHGVMIGSGVGAVTPLVVGTNGMCLLGSTGADPVFAALTSTNGTVTYTVGAGTLNLEADGLDQSNIIYVGKHGNDANDGLTINKAFLTIQAAITAASSGDTVWCFDDGLYTENLTGAAGISIFAPNATLAGAHTIITDNSWTFKELTVATGVVGVTMNTASQEASLTAERITCSGTGIGILCLLGKLYTHVEHATIENGFFVGATNADEVYLDFDEISISGTGTAIAAITGSFIRAKGNCVENTGAGNGQLFLTAGGGAPEITATISFVSLERLSDITAGTGAFLNAAGLNGSLAEAGAGIVFMGGARRIDKVPIGDISPSNATFSWVNLSAGGRLGTSQVAGNTALLQAYDVDGSAYVTFATLTANNTPTMDLDTAVTINSAYIYRTGGTDIPVTDGGTGVSALTDHGVVLGSGAGAVSVTAVGATNQVLLGNTGADPTWGAVDVTTDITGIVPVANGGTGVSTITDHGVMVGSGAGNVTPLAVGTNGMCLLGSTAADPVFAALTSSGGTITYSTGAGTLNLESTNGILRVDATGATQAMAVNTEYTTNRGAGIVAYTLPATATVGDVIEVFGSSANMWSIAQNAGQTIHIIGSSTTTGVGGSLAATVRYDCVRLKCIVTDTDFCCIPTGNITVV